MGYIKDKMWVCANSMLYKSFIIVNCWRIIDIEECFYLCTFIKLDKHENNDSPSSYSI